MSNVNNVNIIRDYPELEGYHLLHKVKVVEVSSGTKLHTEQDKTAVLTLQLLDGDEKVKLHPINYEPYPELENVTILRSERLPQVGDIGLAGCVEGQPHQWFFLGSLYSGSTVQMIENAFVVDDVEKVVLGNTEVDLMTNLVKLVEIMMEAIEKIANSTTATSNGPQPLSNMNDLLKLAQKDLNTIKKDFGKIT